MVLLMSQSSSILKSIFNIGGVNLENNKIRIAARVANVPFWKIAQKIGISEPTLTRWLRMPLDTGREALIMAAIEDLSKGV